MRNFPPILGLLAVCCCLFVGCTTVQPVDYLSETLIPVPVIAPLDTPPETASLDGPLLQATDPEVSAPASTTQLPEMLEVHTDPATTRQPTKLQRYARRQQHQPDISHQQALKAKSDHRNAQTVKLRRSV